MAIKTCSECKKDISSSAKVCPHCGFKRRTLARRIGGLGAIILFALLGFVMWSNRSGTSPEAQTNIQQPSADAEVARNPAPASPQPTNRLIQGNLGIAGFSNNPFRIVGQTNLPDGTMISGILKGDAPECQPNCGYEFASMVVKDGHFFGKLSSSSPLSQGTYTIDVNTAGADVQPHGVQSVIGVGGKNLRGPLVVILKDDGFTSVDPSSADGGAAGFMVRATQRIEISTDGQTSQSACPNGNQLGANCDLPSDLQSSGQEAPKQVASGRPSVEELRNQELDYIKKAHWKTFQADNGMRYLVDVGSLRRGEAGATINFVQVESNAPTVSINPMDVEQFFFDCQGNFRIIDQSASPIEFAPSGSVVGEISTFSCKGEGK